MGKVASQTLEATLAGALPDHTVCRLHWMAEETLRGLEAWCADPALPEGFRESVKNQIEEGRAVRKSVVKKRRGSSRPRKKIVSLTREPMEHIVSGYFQNIRTIIEGAEDPEVFRRIRTDVLIRHFQDYIANRYGNRSGVTSSRDSLLDHIFHAATDWFDVELKAVFGIDVYRTPFDTDKGYQRYGDDAADVIVIRYENLGPCLRPAMKEFLGIDVQIRKNLNIGQEKEYDGLYEDFTGRIKIDGDFLRSLYSEKYARHFYTGAEIEAAIRRWSKT